MFAPVTQLLVSLPFVVHDVARYPPPSLQLHPNSVIEGLLVNGTVPLYCAAVVLVW